MPGIEHTDQDTPTLLEVVLRVQSDFRRQLAPLRVTPLQAGVITYLWGKERDILLFLNPWESEKGVSNRLQEPTSLIVCSVLLRGVA